MRLARPALGALLLVALLACDRAPGAPRAERVTLQFRPVEGTVHLVRITIDQTVRQTLGDRSQEVHITGRIDSLWEVGRRDAAGNIPMTVSYRSLAFAQDGPTGRVEYDSARSSADASSVTRSLALLTGQRFSLTFSPLGELVAVQGLDTLLQRAVDSMELGDPALKESLMNTLRERIGDAAVRERANLAVAHYPDRPLAVGESWTSSGIFTSGAFEGVSTTWTLRERREGVALLEFRTTMAAQQDFQVPVFEAFTFRYHNVRGTQSGTMEVEERTGWAVRGAVSQEWDAMVSLEGVPALAGVSWPVSMRSTVRLERLEP